MAGQQTECDPLLQRISLGDRSAFWTLWLQNKDYLYRICLQLMRRSSEDAEDVLSGAMLKALAKITAHADKIQDARTWLAQLTRNYCIDIHRQRQREKLRLGEIVVNTQQSACVEEAAQPADGEDSRQICLDSALENLPANQKEVIVFRFIGRKSYEEIAERLNLSTTAVRKRVQRARSSLKRMGVGAHSIPVCSCHLTSVVIEPHVTDLCNEKEVATAIPGIADGNVLSIGRAIVLPRCDNTFGPDAASSGEDHGVEALHLPGTALALPAANSIGHICSLSPANLRLAPDARSPKVQHRDRHALSVVRS